MLVVEGKSQKSLFIKEMLQGDEYDSLINTCIIDYADGSRVFSNLSVVHYCESGEDMTVESSIRDFEKNYTSFEHFNRIIFYVNAPEHMIDEFKKLEDKYDKEVVVTIQTKGELKAFQI